jgi:tetratricopeptide (TPR) repeat protein
MLVGLLLRELPWEERAHLLDDYAAALLHDDTDAFLAVLRAGYLHDRRFQERIDVFRMIFDEARDRGHDGREQSLSSYFQQAFRPGGTQAGPVPEPQEDSSSEGASPGERQISAVAMALLLSRSWDERRRIVGAYQHIVESGDLEGLLAALGDDLGRGAGRVCSELQRMLAVAREQGIDRAFEGSLPSAFFTFARTNVEPPLFTEGEARELALLAFTETPTWHRRAELLRKDADLLVSKETVGVLDFLIDRYTGDQRRTRPLIVARDVLQRALHDGIDAALAAPSGPTFATVAASALRRVQDADASVEEQIAPLRQALFQTDPVLGPWLWAQISRLLAERLLGVDLPETGLRPVYGEEALLRCADALAVFTPQTAPDDWLAVQVVLGRAYLHRARGDRAINIQSALSCLQTAVNGFAERGEVRRTSDALVTLAQALRARPDGIRMHNLDTAYQACQQALHMIPPEAASDRAQALVVLGQICFEQLSRPRKESLEEAVASFEEVLSISGAEPQQRAAAEYHLGITLGQLGQLAQEPGDPQRVIAKLERAAELYPRDESPYHWGVVQDALGVAYLRALNDDSSAQRYLLAALEVFEPGEAPHERRRTLLNLGRVHFRARRWAECVEALDEAAALSDYLEDAAFSDAGRIAEITDTANLFERLAYALVQLDRRAEALTVYDAGKTRLLRRLLGPVATTTEIPRHLQDELEAALRALDEEQKALAAASKLDGTALALPASLIAARARADRAREEVRRSCRQNEPEILNPEQIQALVPTGGALVMPLITDAGTVVFLLTEQTTAAGGDLLVLEELRDTDLRSLLEGTDQMLGWLPAYQKWREAFDDIAVAEMIDDEVAEAAGEEYDKAAELFAATMAKVTARLWRLLVGPIWTSLKSAGLPEGAPVVLVPSKWLGLLPISAAWRKVNGIRRYLIEDVALTVAPSCAVLSSSRQRMAERVTAPPSLLGVFNPTDDLRFAEEEAEAVSRPFDVASVLLFGPAADEDGVLRTAPGHTHLHLACHGSFDWLDPLETGLALARETRLTARDVSARLSMAAARLVTLSACETGITEFERVPNEYVGLAGAFLQAGAPSVVSSLWNVDDEATAALMEVFYDQLVRLEISPAEALRQAQRALIGQQQYEHPFYWAAFTVTGC